jgi:hypothetical protein
LRFVTMEFMMFCYKANFGSVVKQLSI